MRIAGLLVFVSSVTVAGCVGDVSDGVGDDDDDDVTPGADAAPGAPDATPLQDCPVEVPLGPVRPTDIMGADKLGRVAGRMPHVCDAELRGILESPDTLWYDGTSIIPGYQDSYGDNINFPVGMRPNTISPSLIAVAGGHGFVFQEIGVFHFPFGDPIGAGDRAYVANFWHVPRAGGQLLPVVWWWKMPTSWTRRIEWMFPKGTVLGEMMFIVTDSGEWYPFEIRTRTRELDHWTVDAYRPFPTAADLADALEAKRTERAEWQTDAEVTALVEHLRDPSTLRATTLTAPHFEPSFDPVSGALDELPALSDPSILQALLMETPFRSARGAVWKADGALRAHAAGTDAAFSIVPRGYNAGLFAVDDETCETCHRDAGRPFKDYYPSIMLYGELWGEDDTFSWHPFETSTFVDESGNVVQFGPPDNRQFRQDFEDAGLFSPYDTSAHGDDVYRKIHRDWKDYVYN